MKRQSTRTKNQAPNTSPTRVPQDPRTKAALILLALGEDVAASLLAHLPRDDVLAIARVMQKLTPGSSELTPDTTAAVIDEFLNLVNRIEGIRALDPAPFVDKLRQKLSPSLHSLLDSDVDWTTPSIRKILGQIPQRALISFLNREHPQTVALILAHLDPAQGGQVIKALDAPIRLEAVVRLAHLSSVSRDTLSDLEESLAAILEQTRNAPENAQPWDKGQGAQKVADMLSRLDPNLRQSMLEDLEGRDPNLYEQVIKKMFQFSDLSRLLPKDLSKVIAAIPTKTLLVALKGSAPALRNLWLRAMSERSAQRFLEDFEQLPPIKQSDVAAAQDEILKVVKQKIAAQEILWPDPADVYI